MRSTRAIESGCGVIRQEWLVTPIGLFFMGCAFLLVVGCSGHTGSQPIGSQESEDSQPVETGAERSGPRQSESTATLSGRSASGEGEATHEVAAEGSSHASQEGDSTHEAVLRDDSIEKNPDSSPDSFLLKVDGITYDYASSSRPPGRHYGNYPDNSDLGPLIARVTNESTSSTTEDNEVTSSTTEDQAASNEVPVFAIKGYDPSFRLAARVDDSLIMFEALSDPKAEEGSDVLDIGGKVSGISIGHRLGSSAAGGAVGFVDTPGKVQRVVRGLMHAPLKPTGTDYFGEKDLDVYSITFSLEDGGFVSQNYRMDTGRLSKIPSSDSIETPSSGIVAPRAFRQAIEQGVDKSYRRLIAAMKVEVETRKRSCSDTRTSQETRTVNSGFLPVGPNEAAYTTNDVHPGGPWGGGLRGTAGDDELVGENGEDEVYGLGGEDTVQGGPCDDEIHGGPGSDQVVGDGGLTEDVVDGMLGKDILYGGDGNDTLIPGKDGKRDEVYCGKGKDVVYMGSEADKFDYVDDSCEEKEEVSPIVA